MKAEEFDRIFDDGESIIEYLDLTQIKRSNSEEQTMNYRQRITINPSIRSGKPCIINTRITVNDVLDYLGGGMTIEEVLDDFPDLTLQDIQACFAFAADRDRHLMMIPDEITV